MTEWLKSGFVVGLIFTVSACTTPQTTPQEPGSYPANYAELVQTWMRTALVDPYSVMDLTISKPQLRHFQIWNGLLYGGGYSNYHVWVTCATYNAKNRMGGYVGLSHEAFWIAEGRIVQTESFPFGYAPSDRTCNEAPS
jgi:hypothetical protein